MWPMPIKIRSFADKYFTIQYVILPEIFKAEVLMEKDCIECKAEVLMEKDCIEYKAEVLMEKDCIEYKEAQSQQCIINMLLADRVVKAFEVQGHEKPVTIQIVEGDISQQYTHVNVTDAHLSNNNEFSASIMKIGGERASRACEKYSEDHSPLKIGKIVSLASGKLHSFFLFHTVLVAVNETTPTGSAINSALSAAFLRLTEICAGRYPSQC